MFKHIPKQALISASDGVDTQRRQSIATLGKLGLGVAAGSIIGAPALILQSPAEAAGACVLTPVQPEGPFYLQPNRVRVDIRENKPGVRCDFEFRIINATTCRPYKNAVLDVWHADAKGFYSGYSNFNPDEVNTGIPPAHFEPVDNQRFLRGTGISDANGVVKFISNFPGWYGARAVHFHVKVYIGSRNLFTGQLYFAEAITAEVNRTSVYTARAANRPPNSRDALYTNFSGSKCVFNVSRVAGPGVMPLALRASKDLAIPM